MRLAYCANAYLPAPYASSIHVAHMCHAFGQHGLAVELIVPELVTPISSEVVLGGGTLDTVGAEYAIVDPGFELTHLSVPSIRGLRRVLYSTRAATHLLGGTHDVVYTRDFRVAVFCVLKGMPVVYEAHEWHGGHPLLRVFRGLIDAPSLLGIVCISRSLGSRYLQAGLAPDRVIIEPDAVDLERFGPAVSRDWARDKLDLQCERPIVCHAGSLQAWRGAEGLLKLAQLTPDMQWVLVGGRDQDIQRFRHLIRQMKLTNVLLVPRVPLDQVPVWLGAADALVMYYGTEMRTGMTASPLKMFEYMASERPVVSVCLPGIQEVLRHNETALLVESGDHPAFAAALRRLMDDPDLARKLASHARSDVERFTWSRRASRLLERIHVWRERS